MNTNSYGIDRRISLTTQLWDIVSLTKPSLSFSIGFSAFFGATLGMTQINDSAFWVGFVVFVLSCGCSCLNNIQDRYLDHHFMRTKFRVLPQKRVTLNFAYSISLFCIIVPIVCLFLYSPRPEAGFLALCSVLLYNCIYTPLKRNSSMAIIPGMLCGMLPVLIGFKAIGGVGFPPHVVISCGLLMAWQVPHTWLIVLQYFPDYNKNALPTFLDLFGPEFMKKLVFVWVAGLTVMMMFFASSIGISTVSWLIALNAIILAIVFGYQLIWRKGVEVVYKKLFLHLNISLFIMMMLSMVNKF